MLARELGVFVLRFCLVAVQKSVFNDES